MASWPLFYRQAGLIVTNRCLHSMGQTLLYSHKHLESTWLSCKTCFNQPSLISTPLAEVGFLYQTWGPQGVIFRAIYWGRQRRSKADECRACTLQLVKFLLENVMMCFFASPSWIFSNWKLNNCFRNVRKHVTEAPVLWSTDKNKGFKCGVAQILENSVSMQLIRVAESWYIALMSIPSSSS